MSSASSPLTGEVRTLLDDPFANFEAPLIFREGRVIATTTVQRLKVVHVDLETPPGYVNCGGEDGCGSYMIPLAVSSGPWGDAPVLVCLICDKALIVRFGVRGRPTREELDELEGAP